MKLIIKPQFRHDRDRTNNVALLEALADKLEQIENAKTVENIIGIKPLKGYTTHYRIYVKTVRHSYRIGAIVRGNTIWLVRFLSRNKIYQRFP